MADEPLRKRGLEQGLLPPEVPGQVAEALESEGTAEGEGAVEAVQGAEEVSEETAAQHAPVVSAPAPAPVNAAPAPQKDRLSTEIETVLQEDLTDMYLKMPPAKQKQFAQKGEETADKIHQMIAKAKVNARRVFDLIRDWLKIIPGVNKFFLEQEAKIKTDKILLVAEEETRRGPEGIA